MRSMVALGVIALAVAACAGRPASASGETSSSPPAASAVPTLAATEVAIDTLPPIDPGADLPTIVCDPDPAQAAPEPVDTTLPCPDAIQLAMRALATQLDRPPDRVYLQRPPCAAGPCTSDAIDTAMVTGWAGEEQITVALDSRRDSVVLTTDDPRASWPAAPAADHPSEERLTIPDAPDELRSRDALPSCGSVDIAEADATAVELCFLAAVLEGRPAEALERVYSLEGDPITWFFSFDGNGPIVLYSQSGSRWTRTSGYVHLTPSSMWSFQAWPGTDATIS